MRGVSFQIGHVFYPLAALGARSRMNLEAELEMYLDHNRYEDRNC